MATYLFNIVFYFQSPVVTMKLADLN